MITKKKYLTLGILFLVVFALVGCSQIKDAVDQIENGDETGSEIVIQSLKLADGGETDTGREKYNFSVVVKNQEADYTYKWSIDDEGEGEIKGSGSKVSYIAPEKDPTTPDIVYNVSVLVKNNEGKTASVSKKLNLKPEVSDIKVVNTTGTEKIEAGDIIKLSVEASDKESEELTYTWYKKAESEDDFSKIPASNQNSLEVEVKESENYTYKVKIDDGDGGIVEKTHDVGVHKAKPVVEEIIMTPEEIWDVTESVTFEVNASDPDGSNEKLSYEWRANPGSFEDSKNTGKEVTYFTPDNMEAGDELLITVEVKDEDGETTTKEKSIDVESMPLEFDGIYVDPKKPTVGETAKLKAVFKTTKDDLSYTWEYDYLGDDTENYVMIEEDEAEVTWPAVDKPGPYEVKVRVEDGDKIIRKSREILVKAEDPTIMELEVIPDTEVYIGKEVSFTANVSDPEYPEDELNYIWEVEGQGSIAEGQGTSSVVYKSTTAGEATVSLKVSNDYYGKDTWSEDVIVKSNPPVIDSIKVTAEDVEGVEKGKDLSDLSVIKMFNDDTLSFSAEASDPDGDNLEYIWLAGSKVIGRGQGISYKPDNRSPASGVPTVRLKVIDGMGGEAKTDAAEIELKNRKPVIDDIKGKETIMAEKSMNLGVEAQDPDNEYLSYYWTATKGSIDESGQIVEYTAPAATGDVTITVIAKDESGVETSYSETITVTNSPVTINYFDSEKDILGLGETTTVTVSAEDPQGEELSYSWSAEAGQIIGEGSSVTYKAPGTDAGTYNITVTVEDPQGSTVSADCKIKVKNIWQKTIDSIASFEDGIEIQGGFSLVGQTTEDKLSYTAVDHYGEKTEDKSYNAIGIPGSFNSIIETDNSYIMAGTSDDSGYILNEDKSTGTRISEASPGNKINDMIELENDKYLTAGQKDGDGYLYFFNVDTEISKTGDKLLATEMLAADQASSGDIIVAGRKSLEGYYAIVDNEGNVSTSDSISDSKAFTDTAALSSGYVLVSEDGNVLKTDSTGTEEWMKSYGDNLQAVLVDGENYLLAGESNGNGYLALIDDNGTLQWEKEYEDAEVINSLIDTGSSYIIMGSKGSKGYIGRVDEEGNIAK